MEFCSSGDSMESRQFISKGVDLEDDSKPARKRVKLRDLESVMRSEDSLALTYLNLSALAMASHYPGSSKAKAKAKAQIETVEEEVSQFTQELLKPNHGSLQEERLYNKSSTLQANHTVLLSFDLNSEVCMDENSACNETVAETNDPGQHVSDAKCQAANDKNIKAVGCRGLDLNEDASSTVSPVHFYPSFKVHSHKKPKDAWESASSAGLAEDTSLKKWVEMKQNGFLTPNYGSIPLAPKPRVRKSKAEVLKRKMEQARKEQVDRFTKIAAPSGLLNGLNPGIINHVRNSKQVHSIIQALVIERGERNKDKENANSWIHRSNLPHGNASGNTLSRSKYAPDHQRSKHAHALSCDEHKVGCQDLCNTEGRLYGHSNDDPLTLSLSSSTIRASGKVSSWSMEKPVNAENVDSLSVKAANVAAQWLQLLSQDIKGRLVALERSRKRVQDVITTELPSLLSKELLSKQGNEFHTASDSITSLKKATAELHRTRWIMLFNQLEQELIKEEKQLESQLNQVNNMMVQCEKGFGVPLLGATEKGCRSDTDEPDGDFTMKAAAASIYSTSSFALSMANVKCC